jgi:hypothetical protein
MTPRFRPAPHHIALLLLFALSLAQACALFAAGRVHANDFKHLWLGTRVLDAGGSPYDPQMLLTAARQFGIESINPYVYLPATGLFLWPFAKLDLAGALVAWSALNWLVAWICVALGPLWLRLNRPARAQLLGALFLVGAMPFLRQMTAGQMNIVVLAALILALGWLIRGRDTAAGFALGLAAAFKIAPLFYLLPFAGMRRWRAAAGLAAGFAAANLAALAWVGPGVHADAVPVLAQMGYGQSTWAEFGMDFYRDPFNQSFNALFHHLLTDNPHTRPWLDLGPAVANAATWVVSLALLALYGSMLLRFRVTAANAAAERAWGEGETALFLGALMLMLLLPSLLWDHYCVQALPVLFWIVGRSAPPSRRWTAAAVAAAAFVLMSYPWRHTAEAFRSGPGILLMSFRLWGLLLLTAYLALETRGLFRRDTSSARGGAQS